MNTAQIAAAFAAPNVAAITVVQRGELFVATVTRNGRVEYIVESLSERTVRNTLGRAGYLSSRKSVPLQRAA